MRIRYRINCFDFMITATTLCPPSRERPSWINNLNYRSHSGNNPKAPAPAVGEILTYKRNTSYHCATMGILTVRLTDEEEQMLARRSRQARMKRATYVRMLIREEPFVTGADVLADAIKRKGDERLRVSRKS